MFDRLVPRLQAVLTLYDDATISSEQKLVDIIPLLDAIRKFIPEFIKWKSVVFGPTFRSSEEARIAILEEVGRTLEATLLLLKSLTAAGTATQAHLATTRQTVLKMWLTCLRNASGTMPWKQGAPLSELLRGAVKLLLPLVVPVVVTAALAAVGYFYRGYSTKKSEVTALLVDYKERLRSCRQFGDTLATSKRSDPEYDQLIVEIGKVLNGGYKSSESRFVELNWVGIVSQLERHGIRTESEAAKHAIEELNLYFVFRAKNAGTNGVSTNVFYPWLSKAQVFLDAHWPD